MNCSTTWPCVALRHAALADRTTMRVGGQVEWLLEPATPDEMRLAWIAALERGYKPRVLGGGANLVIDDGLLPGVIITTERMRRTFRPIGGEQEEQSEEDKALSLVRDTPPAMMSLPPPGDDPRLVCWAGATLPSLVRAARALGYSGLECIVGVPGQVGGGVAMNAGGKYGEMWDVIESVRVLEPDGAVSDIMRKDCSPLYRNGGLGERIVLGAVMRFAVKSKLRVQERMKEILTEKSKVQPVTEASAGCVFKNPDKELSDGRSAGQLVDECGLKGRRRGKVIVSPLHGNFFINQGGATATDTFALMDEVRDAVAQATGVLLAFEVKRWRAGDQS